MSVKRVSKFKQQVILQWLNALMFDKTCYVKDLTDGRNFFKLASTIKSGICDASSQNVENVPENIDERYRFVAHVINGYFDTNCEPTLGFDQCKKGSVVYLAKVAILLLSVLVKEKLLAKDDSLFVLYEFDPLAQLEIKMISTIIMQLDQDKEKVNLAEDFANVLNMDAKDWEAKRDVALGLTNDEASPDTSSSKRTLKVPDGGTPRVARSRNRTEPQSPLRNCFCSKEVQLQLCIERLRKETAEVQLKNEKMIALGSLQQEIDAKNSELENMKEKLNQVKKYEAIVLELAVYKEELRKKFNGSEEGCRRCNISDNLNSKLKTAFENKESDYHMLREDFSKLQEERNQIVSDLMSASKKNQQLEEEILQKDVILQTKDAYIVDLESDGHNALYIGTPSQNRKVADKNLSKVKQQEKIIDKLMVANDQLKTEVTEFEGEIYQLKSEVTKLKKEAEKLKVESAKVQDRNLWLESEIEKLSKSCDKYEREKGFWTEKLENQEKEMTVLNKKLATALQKGKNTDIMMKRMEDERSKMTENLKALQHKEVGLTKAIEDLCNQLAASKKQTQKTYADSHSQTFSFEDVIQTTVQDLQGALCDWKKKLDGIQDQPLNEINVTVAKNEICDKLRNYSKLLKEVYQEYCSLLQQKEQFATKNDELGCCLTETKADWEKRCAKLSADHAKHVECTSQVQDLQMEFETSKNKNGELVRTVEFFTERDKEMELVSQTKTTEVKSDLFEDNSNSAFIGQQEEFDVAEVEIGQEVEVDELSDVAGQEDSNQDVDPPPDADRSDQGIESFNQNLENSNPDAEANSVISDETSNSIMRESDLEVQNNVKIMEDFVQSETSDHALLALPMVSEAVKEVDSVEKEMEVMEPTLDRIGESVSEVAESLSSDDKDISEEDRLQFDKESKNDEGELLGNEERPKLDDGDKEGLKLHDEALKTGGELSDEEGLKLHDEALKTGGELTDGEGRNLDDEKLKIDKEELMPDDDDLNIDEEEINVDDEESKTDGEFKMVEQPKISDERMKMNEDLNVHEQSKIEDLKILEQELKVEEKSLKIDEDELKDVDELDDEEEKDDAEDDDEVSAILTDSESENLEMGENQTLDFGDQNEFNSEDSESHDESVESSASEDANVEESQSPCESNGSSLFHQQKATLYEIQFLRSKCEEYVTQIREITEQKAQAEKDLTDSVTEMSRRMQFCEDINKKTEEERDLYLNKYQLAKQQTRALKLDLNKVETTLGSLRHKIIVLENELASQKEKYVNLKETYTSTWSQMSDWKERCKTLEIFYDEGNPSTSSKPKTRKRHLPGPTDFSRTAGSRDATDMEESFFAAQPSGQSKRRKLDKPRNGGKDSDDMSRSSSDETLDVEALDEQSDAIANEAVDEQSDGSANEAADEHSDASADEQSDATNKEALSSNVEQQSNESNPDFDNEQETAQRTVPKKQKEDPNMFTNVLGHTFYWKRKKYPEVKIEYVNFPKGNQTASNGMEPRNSSNASGKSDLVRCPANGNALPKGDYSCAKSENPFIQIYDRNGKRIFNPFLPARLARPALPRIDPMREAELRAREELKKLEKTPQEHLKEKMRYKPMYHLLNKGHFRFDLMSKKN